MHRRARAVSCVLFLALTAALGGCNTLFFQPDARRYFEPEALGLWHEEVRFQSADGTRLHGWFLPTQPGRRARGTVIYFHGNAANVSNHVFAVRWLPARGYQVFLFDYRGYGESEGRPERSGAIADGVAAIRYVRGREDVDPRRLVVWGHSLGGALAPNALAEAGTGGVQGLVLQGTFASYQGVVQRVLGRYWLTWPLQWPVAYGLFSDTHAPRGAYPALSHVPLLVVHGTRDRTVPPEAGQEVYEAFGGEDKTLWMVPAAGHTDIFAPEASPARDRLVAWMDERLGPVPPPGYKVREGHREPGPRLLPPENPYGCPLDLPCLRE